MAVRDYDYTSQQMMRVRSVWLLRTVKMGNQSPFDFLFYMYPTFSPSFAGQQTVQAFP